jgi:hypothetical protein
MLDTLNIIPCECQNSRATVRAIGTLVEVATFHCEECGEFVFDRVAHVAYFTATFGRPVLRDWFFDGDSAVRLAV